MIQDLYNSTFKIYKPNVVDQVYGNVTYTYVLCSAELDCYITYLAGNKTVFNGKENVIATHRLFCNPVDISTIDRIYVVDNNEWYNILYIDDCDRMGHHYELLLENIIAPQSISVSGTIWDPNAGNIAKLDSVWTTVNIESGDWESAYSTVQALSDGWTLSGTETDLGDMPLLSAYWTEAYTNLVSNSATYLEQFDSSLIVSASGNWNSVYSTVNSNSANWASIPPLSAVLVSGNDANSNNIENVSKLGLGTNQGYIQRDAGGGLYIYDASNTRISISTSSANNYITNSSGTQIATFNDKFRGDGSGWYNLSAGALSGTIPNDVSQVEWDSTYTTVNSNSGYWTEAYTNLVSNSAAYLISGGGDSADLTEIAAASGNWNSTFTTVAANSGAWSGSCVFAASNANQNVADSTAVTLSFPDERIDTLGEWSTNTFTAKETGKYLVNVSVAWQNMDAGKYYQIWISGTGVTFSVLSYDLLPTATAQQSQKGCTIVSIAAGQTIQVGVYQNSGTTETVRDFYWATSISILRVA